MVVDGSEWLYPTSKYIFKNYDEHEVVFYLSRKMTNCSYMFYQRSELVSIDLSLFDTSNVTNMNSMFESCTTLTSLDVSSFDTTNVSVMKYMFSNLRVPSLDLSSFYLYGVESFQHFCSFNTNLISLKVMSYIGTQASIASMFYGVSSSGTFYYNKNYDYHLVIEELPSTWTSVAV